MRDSNPIIQDNAEQTIGGSIELLHFVRSMLDNTINHRLEDADEMVKFLTAREVAGLCLSLDCVCQALEAAFAQHHEQCKEASAK
jgi:hypothetical protein